jgi:hypothetical protein
MEPPINMTSGQGDRVSALMPFGAQFPSVSMGHSLVSSLLHSWVHSTLNSPGWPTWDVMSIDINCQPPSVGKRIERRVLHIPHSVWFQMTGVTQPRACELDPCSSILHEEKMKYHRNHACLPLSAHAEDCLLHDCCMDACFLSRL